MSSSKSVNQRKPSNRKNQLMKLDGKSWSRNLRISIWGTAWRCFKTAASSQSQSRRDNRWRKVLIRVVNRRREARTKAIRCPNQSPERRYATRWRSLHVRSSDDPLHSITKSSLAESVKSLRRRRKRRSRVCHRRRWDRQISSAPTTPLAASTATTTTQPRSRS